MDISVEFLLLSSCKPVRLQPPKYLDRVIYTLFDEFARILGILMHRMQEFTGYIEIIIWAKLDIIT